jgi:hypothetical protein
MSMMAWFDVVLAELARIAAECEALEAMRDVNTVEVRRAAARIRAHASNVFREVSESGSRSGAWASPWFRSSQASDGQRYRVVRCGRGRMREWESVRPGRTRYSGAYQEADK